jgi:hypothetical protein
MILIHVPPRECRARGGISSRTTVPRENFALCAESQAGLRSHARTMILARNLKQDCDPVRELCTSARNLKQDYGLRRELCTSRGISSRTMVPCENFEPCAESQTGPRSYARTLLLRGISSRTTVPRENFAPCAESQAGLRSHARTLHLCGISSRTAVPCENFALCVESQAGLRSQARTV